MSNAALLKNPASLAVVLVEVLGSRSVEMAVAQSSIIHGPRASRLVKVGSMTGFCVMLRDEIGTVPRNLIVLPAIAYTQNSVHVSKTMIWYKIKASVSFVELTLSFSQKSPRRVRLYVPSAVLSRNLPNVAVALAVVLGSRSVEIPVTQSSIIHGPRASKLAQTLPVRSRWNHHQRSCSITWKALSAPRTSLGHEIVRLSRQSSTAPVPMMIPPSILKTGLY